VDVERFAAGLPELFDDFPRSPHPRGRRFDDVIAGVPNLAEENVLALLNLAAGLLGPGESYVEVGTYYGASLIGAMRGNEGDVAGGGAAPIDFVAIDVFSFPPISFRGRDLPAASRSGLEDNLRRFGADGATVLEDDAFEVIEGGALGERRVGVYYFDGPHGYDEQLRGLRSIEPWLADRALLVVDDHDWADVRRATADYLAAQPRAQLLFDIAGGDGGQPQWWAGVAVLAWHG
jgi:hypothetical protein